MAVVPQRVRRNPGKSNLECLKLVKFATRPACESEGIHSRTYDDFGLLEMDTCMYRRMAAECSAIRLERAATGMRRNRYRYRKVLSTQIWALT